MKHSGELSSETRIAMKIDYKKQKRDKYFTTFYSNHDRILFISFFSGISGILEEIRNLNENNQQVSKKFKLAKICTEN